MQRTIHLIRHGQSTFNAHYELHREDPGHVDARLTDLGHAQVAQARAKMERQEVDLVICSPLTRAVQTAVGIFGHREVPIEVTCRHRERLESFCDVGRSPRELAQDFPHLRFDHLDDPWWHQGEADDRGFAVEPEEVFLERVRVFAEWADSLPARRIAVVGHGTFFWRLTGRWLANCEVVSVEGQPLTQAVQAVANGA